MKKKKLSLKGLHEFEKELLAESFIDETQIVSFKKEKNDDLDGIYDDNLYSQEKTKSRHSGSEFFFHEDSDLMM